MPWLTAKRHSYRPAKQVRSVIILPSVKKGGFIIAGQYGKRLMTCRTGAKFDGPWSAPIMMPSSGGSVGFQAGGQAVDYVILVLNDKGARKLMNGKAKLGADASIAAGPVGRNAEMLSYSRTSGLFAGVSLSGTSLGPDSGANKDLYGKKVSGEEIWAGKVQAPDSAKDMLATLAAKSPRTCQPASSNNKYPELCIAKQPKRHRDPLRGNSSETSCGRLCRVSLMKRTSAELRLAVASLED